MVASPTPGNASASTTPRGETRWRWAFGAVAVIALVAGFVWISGRYRTAPTGTSGTGAPVVRVARKSVAILGFTNLSGQKAADSLGNVLVDSLWSQLDTDQLRFVPTDRVNEMKQDLSLGDISGSISQKQAEAIRKYLGVDVLITGTYNVTGKPQHFDIQWNIHLFNAANAQSLGSISQPG